MRPHRDALTSASWSLPAELAAYGLSGRFAHEPTAALPSDAVPSRPLVARHAMVPFIGRADELAELDAWADDPAPVRVRPIHGPAGAGKTRMLIEWVKRRSRAELAGLLYGSLDDDTIEAVAGTAVGVVVIDHAETRTHRHRLMDPARGGGGARAARRAEHRAGPTRPAQRRW